MAQWTVEEGDPQWALAADLYAEVRRYVTGWDKVLEEVESFLKG